MPDPARATAIWDAMRDIVDGWGGWKARARVRMRERLESKRTRELARASWEVATETQTPWREIFRSTREKNANRGGVLRGSDHFSAFPAKVIQAHRRFVSFGSNG